MRSIKKLLLVIVVAPLLLYGQRRMGKTSFLQQLPARLEDGYLPVYIDGQSLGSISRKRWGMLMPALLIPVIISVSVAPSSTVAVLAAVSTFTVIASPGPSPPLPATRLHRRASLPRRSSHPTTRG